MSKIYLTKRPEQNAGSRGGTNPLDSLEHSAATAIAASVPRSLELADWIYAAGLEGRGWHDVTRILAAALGAARCWLIAAESGRARILTLIHISEPTRPY